MRIVATKTLREFWQIPAYRDSEQPLKAWVEVVKYAVWNTPPEITSSFNSADILKNGRVIFDISGNKYRIVAKVNYRLKIVYIRFIGTHRQYDRIDPDAV